MESYEYPYEYKNEVLERFKKYDIVVHTSKEKDYDFLYPNDYSIELKQKNIDNTMFIDLEGEITIYVDGAHRHFYYEERNDFEQAMKFAENILTNKICSISVFSNNDWKCTSFSDENKVDFNELQAFEKVIELTDGREKNYIYNELKKFGSVVKFEFWDKSKNYEYSFEKNKFI